MQYVGTIRANRVVNGNARPRAQKIETKITFDFQNGVQAQNQNLVVSLLYQLVNDWRRMIDIVVSPDKKKYQRRFSGWLFNADGFLKSAE